MKHPESLLQVAIVAYLRAVLPASVRFHAVPNGLVTSKASARRAPKEGLVAGVPDLVLVRTGGLVAYLEIKAGNGKLSPAQQDWIAWCQDNGVPVAVVRSIDDVKAQLAAWHIWTRDRSS